jgi:hypothetical protein
MARVSLLHMGDGLGQRAAFEFEHAMAHRNALGVMSPLTRFSVIPYLIDPMQHGNRPAGKWSLNHQQAHDDALRYLPSQFGSADRGLYIGQDLVDSNLDNPRQRTWWIFQNHMEHYIGGSTIIPNVPIPPPAPQWVYPFW